MPAGQPTRRAFLRTSTAGVAATTSGLEFVSQLPHVAANDTELQPGLVRFDGRTEPLVRLIEESSRERLLEQIADRIRNGESYRNVLAALLLAGVRNVQPRPSVGFKFHCVLVVNSCHLASLAGPDEDRWLPIFWALNYFKSSQADEVRRGGWKMKSVRDSLVPDAAHAQLLFVEGMDSWDVDKADTATAGLVRTAGATAVFNLFARYAARDYRSIGHKAIFLANAWRTLQVIGWQYAEPVLRSLTFALLNHRGDPNPAQNDLDADRPWRESAETINRIPENWLHGKRDDAVPVRLVESFRNHSPRAASETAIDAMRLGTAPQSVWDGVFLGAGELLMRQPGIVGLHGLTTANAMYYLWRHVADDRLRRQLMLQSCSFNPLFRESARGRGTLADRSLQMLHPVAPDVPGEAAVVEILEDIPHNRMRAAQKVHAFLSSGGNGRHLVDAARRLLFLKGRDAHDYKFSSAVLEDYGHVSPPWRSRFLAMSVFNLKGNGHPDNPLVDRTRAALMG